MMMMTRVPSPMYMAASGWSLPAPYPVQTSPLPEGGSGYAA